MQLVTDDGEAEGDTSLTDGRVARRQRNREAVIDALIALVAEGRRSQS